MIRLWKRKRAGEKPVTVTFTVKELFSILPVHIHMYIPRLMIWNNPVITVAGCHLYSNIFQAITNFGNETVRGNQLISISFLTSESRPRRIKWHDIDWIRRVPERMRCPITLAAEVAQWPGWTLCHQRLPGVQSEMDANEMNARKNQRWLGITKQASTKPYHWHRAKGRFYAPLAKPHSHSHPLPIVHLVVWVMRATTVNRNATAKENDFTLQSALI